MKRITITVCDDIEATDIMNVLNEAEEEGVLDFPFQVETKSLTYSEVESWKHDTMDRINGYTNG